MGNSFNHCGARCISHAMINKSSKDYGGPFGGPPLTRQNGFAFLVGSNPSNPFIAFECGAQEAQWAWKEARKSKEAQGVWEA